MLLKGGFFMFKIKEYIMLFKGIDVVIYIVKEELFNVLFIVVVWYMLCWNFDLLKKIVLFIEIDEIVDFCFD